MFGALIGDIVGSRFQFVNLQKSRFHLFTNECAFTDDTICNVAVMDALLHDDDDYTKYIHDWCRRYPNPKGSYEIPFAAWLFSDEIYEYQSKSNGSTMRVSPLAWWFKDYNTVMHHAELAASITHGSEEGIRGAKAVAAAIYCLRMGGTKSDFVHTVDSFYPDFLFQEFPQGRYDDSCMGTVPLACQLFYASSSFEDALRRTIAWGGHSDTLASIVGAIAEAYYGGEFVTFYSKAAKFLAPEMLNVVIAFNEKFAMRCFYRNLSSDNKLEDYRDFVRAQSTEPPKPYKPSNERHKEASFVTLQGTMAEAGIGNDTSISYIINAYQKAVSLGDSQARCYLGDIYRTGKGGTTIDLAKALELYEGSDEGYGHYRCAECYDKGLGTKIDLHKAQSHYKDAYMQCFPLAIRKLRQWNYFEPRP